MNCSHFTQNYVSWSQSITHPDSVLGLCQLESGLCESFHNCSNGNYQHYITVSNRGSARGDRTFFQCIECPYGEYTMKTKACRPEEDGMTARGMNNVVIHYGYYAMETVEGYMVTGRCPFGYCCSQTYCNFNHKRKLCAFGSDLD